MLKKRIAKTLQMHNQKHASGLCLKDIAKNGMLLDAVGSTFLLKYIITSLSEKVSLPHCTGIKIRAPAATH